MKLFKSSKKEERRKKKKGVVRSVRLVRSINSKDYYNLIISQITATNRKTSTLSPFSPFQLSSFQFSFSNPLPTVNDRARGLLAGLATPCRRVDGCKVKFAFEGSRFRLPLLPYFSGSARPVVAAQLLARNSCCMV